ncbi:hypothetical protein [Alkalibacillus aidingensis]|uniref:hypothetical protein n=1 Tax=Alkalibacillus aidingensis TaxID=2747607 RepID=UPI0016600E3D|nr:hypothetical protein [Alkalibacillus aidingensis]
MRYVALLLLISLLTGCNNGPKEEDIQSLLAPTPDTFSLYVIVEEQEDRENRDFDLKQILSEESLDVTAHGDGVWGVDSGLLEVFDIEEYPTFLIFNQEEFLLQTTNVDEVDQFLSSNDPWDTLE